MSAFDATERRVPFRRGRERGAILFDAALLPQAPAEWFEAAHWGDRAQPVAEGGRGGAWFVDAPCGALVLRHYLRGGAAALFSRDRYAWQGADRTRGFAEFRFTRALHAESLPVPRPYAARYVRHGLGYASAILLERLVGVESLAARASAAGVEAPWQETGRLVARFHRAGVDHADLNAHNILFDARGHGWLIDFDRGRRRVPAVGWRERNLARLLRSLLKLRGARTPDEVRAGFDRLRMAYDAAWANGA